jgi:hypothetical protein
MGQMVTKYPKYSLNIPNCHKIYQHFPILGPLKFTQIGIFLFENKPSGSPARLSYDHLSIVADDSRMYIGAFLNI